MKIDGDKLLEAMQAQGVSVANLVKVSKLKQRRIYQLIKVGGNTNDLSAKALAKVLKVSIDDIKGE